MLSPIPSDMMALFWDFHVNSRIMNLSGLSLPSAAVHLEIFFSSQPRCERGQHNVRSGQLVNQT